MKRQRHKHKESFSILLMSNTGGSSRQLHFSMTALRLLFVSLLIICIVVVWLAFLSSSEKNKVTALRSQLDEKEEIIRLLEDENENLTKEKQRLAKENMDMLVADSGSNEADEEPEAKEETEESVSDPSFPSLYPSSETGMVIDIFSEEQPYLALNTHVDNHVIAAGDGMVVVISSDDTYPLILEVEHASGHRTRYMCRQEATLNTEIGAQVSAGDTLITITTDNTQLDYQVIFEGEVIDPFNVIDAKG